jgi:hypothetical protein
LNLKTNELLLKTAFSHVCLNQKKLENAELAAPPLSPLCVEEDVF